MKNRSILVSSRMSQIDWRHDGRRVTLPVKILGAENIADMTSVDATALIDTGATVSGINAEIARSLNLQPVGKRPIMTAHGLAHIEHYLFRVGVYPDGWNAPYPYIFNEVIGLSLSGTENFSALLGMDILRNCDFSIDRSGNCRLVFG